jgi:hypothetical protein
VLHPDAFKAAEFGAEAEAIDAELERGAVAVEESPEKRLELKRACHGLIDLDELPRGEFFPARANGSIVTEAI